MKRRTSPARGGACRRRLLLRRRHLQVLRSKGQGLDDARKGIQSRAEQSKERSAGLRLLSLAYRGPPSPPTPLSMIERASEEEEGAATSRNMSRAPTTDTEARI
jgi:hypothetical protein